MTEARKKKKKKKIFCKYFLPSYKILYDIEAIILTI